MLNERDKRQRWNDKKTQLITEYGTWGMGLATGLTVTERLWGCLSSWPFRTATKQLLPVSQVSSVAPEKRICQVWSDPSDRETHCNTSYHKIGMWGVFAMWLSKVCRFVSRLFIKIDPSNRETHWNTSYHKTMWICKVWRIVSMLYIRMYTSVGETHWNTSYHSINIC